MDNNDGVAFCAFSLKQLEILSTNAIVDYFQLYENQHISISEFVPSANIRLMFSVLKKECKLWVVITTHV